MKADLLLLSVWAPTYILGSPSGIGNQLQNGCVLSVSLGVTRYYQSPKRNPNLLPASGYCFGGHLEISKTTDQKLT